MRVAVTCECGHVTEPDTQDVSHDSARGSSHSEEVAIRFCSQCGRSLAGATPLLQAPPVDPSSGPRTFQQLWQSRLNATEEATVEQQPKRLESETLTESQQASKESGDRKEDSSTSGRRSLWAVMGGSTNKSHAERLHGDEHVAQQNSPASKMNEPTSKPKGLWSVMSTSAAVDAEQVTPINQRVDVTSKPLSDKVTSPNGKAASPPKVERGSPLAPATPITVPGVWGAPPHVSGTTAEGASVSSTSQATRPSLLGLRRLSAGPIDESEDYGAEWCWQAIVALGLGIAAVCLAALSLKPGWLVRLPSLIAGIVALMVGFTAIGDVRRARGQLKGRFAAVMGIVLGALGMLLAPLLFARMGDSWRENAGREVIANRLRQIGSALDQHHAQHGQFPPAVVYSKRVDAKQPLHGWMTALLPHLGHEPVHRRIDLTQSFDSAVNHPSMQQVIPEFLVPGRKPIRSQRGLGISHFAGVGGEIVNEQVGLMHLGIFAEEGAVRREQITDGLAQTIIVGEIVDPLPAWGEPGNLRSIGNGLNKQFHGFGNPAGTGATFLHADGSVKFYSNKTDRRILQQLETRDGGN